MRRLLIPTLLTCFASAVIGAESSGDFRWKAGPPLIGPVERVDDPCYSIKDPTVVRFDDRWHLFCTIRSVKRTHQIEYLSFDKWENANAAERHVLKISDGYFCAPQVFYFTPHKKWYMILQVRDDKRQPWLQPAFSTTEDLAKPDSWSKPSLLYPEAHPSSVKSWIDFWVICDDRHAHLFFTSNDGRMWRAQTNLTDFPLGWSQPQVALQADVFEASHTYRLKGRDQYLTVIEALNHKNGGRYYKAYLADRLDGTWKPLADSIDKPFAGSANTTFAGDRWTDSISHGELIRTGCDQRLEVDPDRLRLLFQGVLDKDRMSKPYGEIPWRLGLLEPAR